MRTLLFAVWVIIAVTGCIDEKEFDLPSAPPRIVVDGVISTIPSESYVKLGWSTEANALCKDDFGIPVRCEPDPGNGTYNVNGTVSVFENESVIATTSFQMIDKEGEIRLDLNVSGTPGSKYVLQIDLDYKGNQEHYTATTYMLPTPEITDITYTIRKGDVGKTDNMVPLISFNEP